MTNGDIVDTFNRFDLASILRIIGNIQYASRPLSKWLESSGEFTILGVDELNLQDHRDVIRSIWPKWTDERFAELFELHGSKLALARFCFPSGADGVLFASFNDELWEAPVWSASKELAMLPLSAHRISDLERRARDA